MSVANIMELYAADLLSAGLIVLLSTIYFYLKYKDFPAGPYGLPLLGYSPFLGENAIFTLTKLIRKYGNIFSINFGPQTVVVVSDWDFIKEVFVKHGAATSGRPNLLVSRPVFSKESIIFNHGFKWKEQRNFTLQILRDFGFGKSSLEGLIMFEIEKLTEFLVENAGKPVEITKLFVQPVLNIIWNLTAGKRFEEFDEFLEILKRFRGDAAAQGIYGIVYHLPFLRYIIPQMRSKLHEVETKMRNIKVYMEKEIRKHEDTFEENNLKDFIDVYLAEICKRREKHVDGHDVSPYDREHLMATIMDLFIAGGDTTNLTMCWAFLFMAHHPQIQRRIQAELDAVVATDSFLSTSSKALAPYTEATLLEVQRHPTLLPLSLPHMTTKDVTLKSTHKIFIPKGTNIYPNIYAVHHDEQYWGDPDVFRPERFLNEDGTKVIRHERFMPFFVGPRTCPGESLAKMELHLFFSSLLRRFTFEPIPGQPKPSMDFVPGTFFRPRPFSLIAHPR